MPGQKFIQAEQSSSDRFEGERVRQVVFRRSCPRHCTARDYLLNDESYSHRFGPSGFQGTKPFPRRARIHRSATARGKAFPFFAIHTL
jgi:hypothetical protein